MITVRPARPDDARAIAAIYAPHVVDGVASFETTAPNAAEIALRMAAGHRPWLVASWWSEMPAALPKPFPGGSRCPVAVQPVTAPGASPEEEHGRVAEDQILAYAYAAPYGTREAYRWAAETTIYVAAGAQGQGVGRRLYAALLDSLREQGFTQAIARIALPNEGSVALHEALGFHHAGTLTAVGWKLNRWIDVGLWQRALADPVKPPMQTQDVVQASGGS